MTYGEEQTGSVNRNSPLGSCTTATLCFLSLLVKRENRLILFEGTVFAVLVL